MRVDVSAANSYASEVGEEEIMTPVRPSEKAMGKRRAPLDAEPDEEDLRESPTSAPLLIPWLNNMFSLQRTVKKRNLKRPCFDLSRHMSMQRKRRCL